MKVLDLLGGIFGFIAKNCLITLLVKSRLALGSPGCRLVGCHRAENGVILRKIVFFAAP